MVYFTVLYSNNIADLQKQKYIKHHCALYLLTNIDTKFLFATGLVHITM